MSVDDEKILETIMMARAELAKADAGEASEPWAVRDLLSALDQAEGKDWLPTTSIDATIDELDRRGLHVWADSIRTFLGSTSAYYTSEAFKREHARADSEQLRAESAEARVRVLEAREHTLREALELLCDWLDVNVQHALSEMRAQAHFDKQMPRQVERNGSLADNIAWMVSDARAALAASAAPEEQVPQIIGATPGETADLEAAARIQAEHDEDPDPAREELRKAREAGERMNEAGARVVDALHRTADALREDNG